MAPLAEVEDTGRDWQPLPRELIWIYLVAPWISAYLFDRASSWREYLFNVAGNYVPFILIPLACHTAYRSVVARVAARIRYFPAQLFVHGLVSATISAAVGLMTVPIHAFVDPTESFGAVEITRYTFICAVIGAIIVVPAVLVQRLRERVRANERRAQLAQRAALEAQLQALQARTDPHFFFNTINTVASLITEDPVLAERTLERLAELFRYALDSARVARVPLRRELEIIEDYLAVQHARFGERLRWAIHAAPELEPERVFVPPLLLQPLVENAVLHGIAALKEGGHITLRLARTSDGRLEFLVLNDGSSEPSPHRGSGSSLRELGERLRLLYGEVGAQLEAGPRAEGGYRVRLVLPSEPPPSEAE